MLHATAVKCQWDSILVGKGRAEQPFHKSTRFNLLPVRCTSRDTDSASKKGFWNGFATANAKMKNNDIVRYRERERERESSAFKIWSWLGLQQKGGNNNRASGRKVPYWCKRDLLYWRIVRLLTRAIRSSQRGNRKFILTVNIVVKFHKKQPEKTKKTTTTRNDSPILL